MQPTAKFTDVKPYSTFTHMPSCINFTIINQIKKIMETTTLTDFSDIRDHKLLPNLNVLIGKYLNRYGYSDVNVIGKIISVRGNSFVTIKRIKAERDTSVKLDFHVGGFSAHCSNQHAQKWNFTETDETFEVRLSKGYLRSVRIQNEPHEFYDYNF